MQANPQSGDQQPTQVFILGTGRSGTNAVAQMLSQLPGCHVAHEAVPQLLEEVSAYQKGNLTHDQMVSVLRETRSPSRIGGERLSGESNQRLSFILPCLAEAFPNARYIWIIRDGRDVVASTYRRGWYTGDGSQRSLHWLRWERYRVRADELGEMETSQWNALPAFAKNCWYWAYTNRAVEREVERLGLPVLSVTMEQLESRMPEVMNFLGRDASSPPSFERTNAEKRDRPFYPDRPVPWPHWTPAQRRWFERLAGDLMDRHYAHWQNQWGRGPLAEVSSICRHGIRRSYVKTYDTLVWAIRPIRRRLGLAPTPPSASTAPDILSDSSTNQTQS